MPGSRQNGSMLHGIYQASLYGHGSGGSAELLQKIEKLREENAALRRELRETHEQVGKLSAALRRCSEEAGAANDGLAGQSSTHPLIAGLTRDQAEKERLIVGVPLSDYIV